MKTSNAIWLFLQKIEKKILPPLIALQVDDEEQTNLIR